MAWVLIGSNAALVDAWDSARRASSSATLASRKACVDLSLRRLMTRWRHASTSCCSSRTRWPRAAAALSRVRRDALHMLRVLRSSSSWSMAKIGLRGLVEQVTPVPGWGSERLYKRLHERIPG